MIHHFINITAAVETCLNGTSPGLPLQNDSRDALTGTSHTTPDNDCTDALIGASHKPVSNFPHIFNSANTTGTGQALSLLYFQLTK